MDLKSTKLGKDVKERSQVIGKVLASIDNLDLDFDNAEIDVLGDAYELFNRHVRPDSRQKSWRILYTTTSIQNLSSPCNFK